MPTSNGQCLSDPVTGAAGRAFVILRDNAASGLGAAAFAPGSDARKILSAILQAVTTGVLEELRANGVVSVSVAGGGLQTSTNVGVSTGAPVTPVVLSGTIT